ncbi:MAG: malonate transporter [Noviherbaspirillum sp.]|jgi:predicted permease|nr:malonate transporter [Noviherbaspirillum sp.]MDB5793899.1 malonate transporter [Noviherbaspirillum sp.]
MAVFDRILGIILPVFGIIALGYGYARLRGEAARLDMTAVNRLSTDVLCPLLIFTALAAKDFDLAQNGMLILAGVLISLGSGLIAWPVARLLGYDVRSFVPPMMYNNCGNMGLPLAVLAFGSAGLPAAVALFVAGNLVYFSVGIKIIETGEGRPHTPFWRFLANPMMISMLLGVACAVMRVTLPAPLAQAMRMLGEACIPLMLFALGVRMLDVSLRSWHIGLVGAIVCPLAGLAVAWILDGWLAMPPMQRGQMYLFASLPPAVFCFMIAERYRQEPEKVAAIVLLGNLAALAFVPVGLWMGLRS